MPKHTFLIKGGKIIGTISHYQGEGFPLRILNEAAGPRILLFSTLFHALGDPRRLNVKLSESGAVPVITLSTRRLRGGRKYPVRTVSGVHVLHAPEIASLLLDIFPTATSEIRCLESTQVHLTIQTIGSRCTHKACLFLD